MDHDEIGQTRQSRRLGLLQRCCDVAARWKGRDQDPSFLGAGSAKAIKIAYGLLVMTPGGVAAFFPSIK
jgi:hypothetical protein